MSWYKKWFGTDYLDVYTHRNEEEASEFLSTLQKTVSLDPQQRILDLCCGTGRYSLMLARRGCSVTGLDLSEDLIRRARNEAETTGVAVDFMVRDMREIPFSGYFHGVLNMFTSFGYFSSDGENERVISAASRALMQGGWMVLDFMNKDYILNNFEQYDRILKGNITIEQRRSINRDTDRIEKEIVLRKNGKTRKYFESVRLYTPEELREMFRDNTLTVITEYGDYNGTQYTADSPRFIMIGRKT